jgi:glycine betaine/choline ABC-type transport system substrate-binding protein
MDLGLLYKALEQRQVDMVAANSTDGLLSVLDVRVLEDDKRYFPPYQAALAVRSETLAQAKVKSALAELSGKFSDDTMRRLNHQVDGEHRRASEVAAAFLESAGLAGARQP